MAEMQLEQSKVDRRYWYPRLSAWAKSEYRKAAIQWCDVHRQYLSDCPHFREWLIEADNDRKDG